MGPGMIGPGVAIQNLPRDLSVTDVQNMLQSHLSWMGNPNLKLGEVKEQDKDTITADLTTQDGSLVDRLEVNRHTGWLRPLR
jgi:hypothetical protein